MIVSCSCGAKVRVPDDAAGKAFRCPKCKDEFPVAAGARVLATYRAQPGSAEAQCPICQTFVAAEEAVITCPDCEVLHHKSCWQEIGGCSTYGCPQTPELNKDVPSATPLAAWGDTKTCPACGETIKSIALRCRYCGTDFDTVDPLKAKDLRRAARTEAKVKMLQHWTIALFLVSLIGCLAPLTAILGFALLWPKRDLLARRAPVHAIMLYSGLGISLVYSVLLLIFVVHGMVRK